jgi:aminoglycoside phosphotransferase (APT) family kinase protein
MMPPGQLLRDPSTAAWLAGMDPALSMLPAALSGIPGDWTLHDAQWEPQVRCVLAYRVGGKSPDARFACVELGEAAWSTSDYRDDPHLPGLAAACDPATMTQRLSAVLQQPVTGLRIAPVRYRPGSRCVLRYDYTVSGTVTAAYVKVLRHEAFEGQTPAAVRVARAESSSRLCSKLLAVWPDLAAVTNEAVSGKTVSRALGDAGLPAHGRTYLAGQLGGLLAQFHALDVPTDQGWGPEDQLRALKGLEEPVRVVDVTVADRLASLTDALASASPGLERPVLGHGGFRPGQVLVDGSHSLTVLDLDGVCRTDAGRDLGSALAHLEWQAIRHPDRGGTLEALSEAFLAGYRSAGGCYDPQLVQWWRTAALLQVAARRYRRLEIHDWQLVPRLLDAANAHQTSSDASMLAVITAPSAAPDLLDRSQTAPILQAALESSGAGVGEVMVKEARLLKSAPGRRHVVRYTVVGENGTTVPLLAKAYSDPDRARMSYAHLVELSEGPFSRGRMRVPEPVAYLASQRLVVYRPVDGVPLSELDGERAVQGARDAADWLATLHSSGVDLPRTFDLEKEVITTQQWAATIERYDRRLGREARRLASHWADAVLPITQTARVPLHKDFHPGHVIVGGQVCAIDLDEARYGEPALDVAHFCAYLSGPGGKSQQPSSLSDAFLDAYVESTGWTDLASFDGYSAYSWLKIAKQLAVGSGPFGVEHPDRRAAVAEALERGIACLPR